MRRLVATAVLALAAAPAAHAWSPITTVQVTNSMQPGVLRTATGTELAAYSDSASTLKVWSSAKGDVTVATGLLSVGKPALVELPAGPIELYAPATTAGFAQQGVLRWESSSDGASWSGPFKTGSPNLGDVEGAAVRSDGTPMFSQDSTFGITVYQGLNGETSNTVFTGCCGYAESLAVDSTGLAQIAFWSNANAFPNLFVYETLNSSGAGASAGIAFGQPRTAPRDDDVPLVADGAGNTFMGYAPGYPSGTAFTVNTFRGGHVAYSAFAAKGAFDGGDPHMGLAVDPSNRLWAAWTQRGAVQVRRSRSAAHHFGAANKGSLAGQTAYQLAALALTNGSVDVFVNTGAAIVHQTFLPVLTVTVTKTTITVRDDGVGVKATVKGGGHTVKTNAKGQASLKVFKRHTHLSVTAAGYAGASATKP